MTVWRPIKTAPRDGSEFIVKMRTGRITKIWITEPTPDSEREDAEFKRMFANVIDDHTPTHWIPMPKDRKK